MTPIIPLILRFRLLRRLITTLRQKRPKTRNIVLLPVAAAFMALTSCREDSPPSPPPVVVDTEPLGNGLSVIGFALLGAAVVGVLGKMLTK